MSTRQDGPTSVGGQDDTTGSIRPALIDHLTGALLVTSTGGTSADASVSSVAASATTVTIAAANARRVGLTIYNDSSAILYLKLGATASSSSYTVQMAGGSYYELPQPCYPGVVDGVWASATGNARITEMTS